MMTSCSFIDTERNYSCKELITLLLDAILDRQTCENKVVLSRRLQRQQHDHHINFSSEWTS